MYSEAAQDWLSLFNENVAKIWSSERKELRKTGMIITVLGFELNKMHDEINKEVNELRNRLTLVDKYKEQMRCSKCLSELENKVPSPDNKENDYSAHNISEITLTGIKPLQLRNDENQTGFDWKNSNIILTEESPETLSSITPRFNENIHEIYLSDNDFGSRTSVSATSPKINNLRKFSRNKRPKNISASYSVLDLKRELPRKPEIIDDNKSPKNNYVIDATIIENTPPLCLSKRCISHKTSKRSKLLKNSKSSNNSTLTQMFSSASNSKCNSELSESNELHFQSNNTNHDYIVVGDTEPGQKETHLSCVNKSKVPEIKYKTVVRGKARKELEGWDCEDCKKFYEALEMTPSSIKQLMNKCSKHRSKFKPDDYTPAGFWNLTFSPSEDEDEDDKSIIFQL